MSANHERPIALEAVADGSAVSRGLENPGLDD
jgi:hypothetical protein